MSDGEQPSLVEDGYFTDPDGDFVIYTSDKIELKVLKAILERGSPFFRSMFSIPQPGTQTQTSLVAGSNRVDVTETSAIFSTLLRYIYPVVHPHIESTEELFYTLRAAEKYEIVPALLSLRQVMIQDRFIKHDPVRIYAIAMQFDLSFEARKAADATLEYGLLRTDALDGPEYDGFAARDYNILIRWHKKCCDDAVQVLSNYKLTSASACTTCQRWGCCWWELFSKKAVEVISVRPLSNEMFTTDFMVQAITNGTCETRWSMAFSANTRLLLSAIRTKLRAIRQKDVFGRSRFEY